jgi:hypothetical protein
MKKLLGSTLALAMFLPAGANAELLKNLKVSGQLDIQADAANNVTDFQTRVANPTVNSANDRIGSVNTRLIVKADWDLLDDVHSRVTLVKGANNQAGGARAYGSGAQNLDAWQTQTFVQEASVKIDKLFGAVDTTMGRQFYGEPGDLIVYFGPKDNYGLSVTALDAFRADWNGEHIGITGLGGKLAGGSIGSAPADTDLTGVVAALKGYDMHAESIYLYNKVTHSANQQGALNGLSDNLWVLGAKTKLTAGGLTVKAEVAKNFGQNRTTAGAIQAAPAANPLNSSNYNGWGLLANAAYKADINNVGSITPWGEFAYGTGRKRSAAVSNSNEDFQMIASDYRPGGIYGRFDTFLGNTLPGNTGGANVAGLTNKTIYGLGVKANPAAVAKLTVGAQWYHYAWTRTSLQTAQTANGQNSRNIGSEVDVTAEWKHSENVGLKLTLGTFQPGAWVSDIKGPNATSNPATLAALDTNIRF